MIQKIKDLMRVQEEISKISKKMDEDKDKIGEFSNAITKLSMQVDELCKCQNSLAIKIKEDSTGINEIREEFRKEINNFKILKSRLEIRLIEKFDEEIKQELLPKFERLEKHVKGFEELGSKVALITNRVVSLSSEMQKFSEIGQNIKKEDFELTKFANQLKTMDNEKLELMRKIDTMERLVGKMRRSR